MKPRACRHRIALIPLLWLITRGMASANMAGDFDAANKLFEQGKFTEAASAYQTLVQSGWTSAPLFFNLGNAAFKSGEVGRAVAAYRQAERLAPRDPDVRANLQFIRGQIPGPSLAPDGWLRTLGKLTANEWTGLATATLWCWLLSLTAIQFRPSWKQSLRGFMWLSGAVTVALGACLAVVLTMVSAPVAVVTVRQAVVRNGPIDESPQAFLAHDGAELKVLDHKDDWLQVSAGGRNIGWLKREQTIVLPQVESRPSSTPDRPG